MTAIAEPTTDELGLQRIPLEEIYDSPLNPRKHFAPAALKELADSLQRSGQLEPVLARPRPEGGYELAAGHRRRRAAVMAGLTELLVLVRPMADPEFVEALNVSNLQRDDLHPLEEAEGFKTLMTTCGYDESRLAERCGRSRGYVYDRLSLLGLTKEAKVLFLAGEIPTGHAIELARLRPSDQARAIDTGAAADHHHIGGLFVIDYGHQHDLDGTRRPRKPVSLGEFRKWIADHVRFDPLNQHVPELFPATVAALSAATEAEEKVVKITRDYRVADEARDAKERTYGGQSWKRADGVAEKPRYGGRATTAKACPHAVLGVVVAGPGRGEAFKVCIAKKTCKVHWAKEQQEATRRKAPATSTAPPKDLWELKQEREDAERKRWWQARAELKAALEAGLASASAAPDGPLVGAVLRRVLGYGSKPPTAFGSLEEVVRFAAGKVLSAGFDNEWALPREAPESLKALGIDAKAVVDRVAPKEKPAKATAAKPAAKARKSKPAKKSKSPTSTRKG